MEVLVISVIVGMCIFVWIKCSDCIEKQNTPVDYIDEIKKQRFCLLLDTIRVDHPELHIYDTIKDEKDSFAYLSITVYPEWSYCFNEKVSKISCRRKELDYDRALKQLEDDIKVYKKRKEYYHTKWLFEKKPVEQKTKVRKKAKKKSLSSKKTK